MGACRFQISETNPNPSGGCLCSENRNPDTAGPYAIYPGNEMASYASPHVVQCLGCAQAFVNQVAAGAEQIRAGEDNEVAMPEPIEVDKGLEQRESPSGDVDEIMSLVTRDDDTELSI